MKRHMTGPLLMMGLLALSAVSQLGCQNKTTDTSDPILIELSEPEAVFVEKDTLGQKNGELFKQRIRLVRWQVKYRFLKGRADPDAFYVCSVQLDNQTPGSDAWGTSGKDLGIQGVFKDDLLHEGKEIPKSLKLLALQMEMKGGAAYVISKEVVCDIKK